MNNISYRLPEQWTSVKEFTMLLQSLNSIEDPRINRRKLHPLVSILVISLCAAIGGIVDWEEVVDFAQRREDFFKKLVPLPHGIPSKDTFARVIERIHPSILQAVTNEWRQSIEITSNVDDHIILDGKKLRASRDGDNKKACYLVNAWASKQGALITQKRVPDKENEMLAMLQIIETIDLAGSTVSIDAIGCQKSIARAIKSKKADYLLALKDNQHKKYSIAKEYFDVFERIGADPSNNSYYKTIEKGHGRIETRECYVLDAPAKFKGVDGWFGIKTIGMVVSQRCIKGINSIERRYYISSLPLDAKKIAQTIRNHWSIENSLHWVLDVDFCEDRCRIREGFSPQNLSWIRALALSLLKNDPQKISIKRKIRWAVDDSNYILKILLNSGC